MSSSESTAVAAADLCFFWSLVATVVYVKLLLAGVAHEAIHRNVFSSSGGRQTRIGRWCDNLLGSFLTEMIGVPLDRWSEEHTLEHHIFTGRYDKDPDERLPGIRFNECEKWVWWWSPLGILFLPLITLGVLPLSVIERNVSGIVTSSASLTGTRVKSSSAFQAEAKKMLGIAEVVIRQLTQQLAKQSAVNFLPAVIMLGRISWSQGFLGRTDLMGSVNFCLGVSTFCNLVTFTAFHASHNVEQAKSLERPVFYPGIDWGEAQVNASINFARRWWMPYSGLENQIEHHLFPTLSIDRVAEITPIVKRTCAEFGIAYVEAPDFLTAAWWHLSYVMKLALSESVAQSPSDHSSNILEMVAEHSGYLRDVVAKRRKT